MQKPGEKPEGLWKVVVIYILLFLTLHFMVWHTVEFAAAVSKATSPRLWAWMLATPVSAYLLLK